MSLAGRDASGLALSWDLIPGADCPHDGAALSKFGRWGLRGRTAYAHRNLGNNDGLWTIGAGAQLT
jgi:hypothetical protein